MNDAFLLCPDFDLHKHEKLDDLEASGLIALMREHGNDTKQIAEILNVSETELLRILELNQMLLAEHQN